MSISETLISFETAKLAKEKGLPSEFGWGYYPGGGDVTLFRGHAPIYAPTQSLLQKWLRDKYNLFINIDHKPHSQKFNMTISGKYDEKKRYLVNHMFMQYNTYEEALEAGLLEGLKLIKL